MPIESCYADTSLLVTALVSNIEHHQAAIDFCNLLIADGATVYISELVRLEFSNSYRRLIGSLPPDVFREHGLRRWDKSATVRQRWLDRGKESLEDLVLRFERTLEVQLTRELIDEAHRLMGSHNLQSYDAAHVATAIAAGATDLAAVDGHFERADGLVTVHIVRDPTSVT